MSLLFIDPTFIDSRADSKAMNRGAGKFHSVLGKACSIVPNTDNRSTINSDGHRDDPLSCRVGVFIPALGNHLTAKPS